MFVRFKYLWRPVVIAITAATIPINNRPIKGKGQNFHLNDRWLACIRNLDSDRAVRYVLGKNSGWVNFWDDANVPVAESLTMGGNIARVVDEAAGFWKLDVLRPSSALPDPLDRLHVHMFTCVDVLGRPRPPADGTLVVWYPFLINGDAWVEKSKVEVFDTMPEPLFPQMDTPTPPVPVGPSVLVMAGAVIRQTPGGVKIYKLAKATLFPLISESHGWTQVGDKRWVETSMTRSV